MAMKKSIGRTLAHIDVAANTSVRIHEDFFNTHRISRHLSERSVKRNTTSIVQVHRNRPTVGIHRRSESPCLYILDRLLIKAGTEALNNEFFQHRPDFSTSL